MSRVERIAVPLMDRHEVDAMRGLWCAVINEQLRLATKPRDSSKYLAADIEEARRWIGSRGFREVCNLAGLEPEWIEAGVRQMLLQRDVPGCRVRARSRRPSGPASLGSEGERS